MFALLSVLACAPADLDWQPASLASYPNPFGADDARYRPQPRRDNPLRLLDDGHGSLWVTLQGSADHPGSEVARVSRLSGKSTRVDVGSSPTGLALHPGGRWLVVFNRFSNFATVVDTWTEATHRLPVDFYTGDGVFGPDGSELWVTNRWRDAIGVLDIDATSAGLTTRGVEWIDGPFNPRDIAISDDARWIAVGTATGLEASVIERRSRTEKWRLPLGSPPSDVAFAGDFLFVATLSAGTHHPGNHGPDTDGDGLPGDSTPNTDFSDVQNEIAVYRTETGEAVRRYTSDTLCCYEPGDVRPDDPLGGLLPDAEDWIVGGAMPEQLAVGELDGETWLFVTYASSDAYQRFAIDRDTGALAPGRVVATTGHNPFGIAVSGGSVFVANRLSETVGEYDARSGSVVSDTVVGDISDGQFPTTQAELGELIFFVTPAFGDDDDGDRACVHCHRENSTLDRPISLTNAVYPGFGLRMNVALHGQYDTLPWLWEASGNEEKFRLGPPSAADTARSSQGGGDEGTLGLYLLTEPMYLPNPHRRGVAAERGRALFERNDVGCATCHPAPTFAASDSHNPFGVPVRMSPVVTPVRSVDGANFDLLDGAFLASFPETEQDRCIDVCPVEICMADPKACDDLRTVRLGAPSLRGLWDHPPRMLHHGQAIGLREVLCTPGHPALLAGEVGFNELDGQADSHGGTSHLSVRDIDDLIAYLLTL